MSSSLDPEVLALVEMSPVEDLLLALLRSRLPSVDVNTRVKTNQTQSLPFVLVRSTGSWGDWGGDPRFLDASSVEIHAFCEGINADEDANLLSEAVRVILRDSLNVVVPGRGHLIHVEMLDRPRRTPDWATSTGPVQYADLPTGVERWEATYRVAIRKPASKPFPAP